MSFAKCVVAPSSDFTAGLIRCTVAAATSESRTLESVLHTAAMPCLTSATASLDLCAPENLAVVVAASSP